jgi:hypothetical protein
MPNTAKHGHMKLTITFLLCIASISVTAQTRNISYSSHGGDPENLGFAMETIFNMDNSNFGAAPERIVTTAALDSVIYISEDVAVMVTSTYCKNLYRNVKESLWRAGKDTVYRHNLFSRKHSLDSIKRVLQAEYNFQNPVHTIKFIGYDNEEEPIINNSETRTIRKGNIDQSSLSGYGPAITILIFVSLIAGLIARLLNKQTGQ